MKTKEEILNDLLDRIDLIEYPHYSMGIYHKSTAWDAMDEYAKQQSIAFAKWMDHNAIRNGEDVWTTGAGRSQHRHTSDQLYEQFIEQQALQS